MNCCLLFAPQCELAVHQVVLEMPTEKEKEKRKRRYRFEIWCEPKAKLGCQPLRNHQAQQTSVQMLSLFLYILLKNISQEKWKHYFRPINRTWVGKWLIGKMVKSSDMSSTEFSLGMAQGQAKILITSSFMRVRFWSKVHLYVCTIISLNICVCICRCMCKQHIRCKRGKRWNYRLSVW